MSVSLLSPSSPIARLRPDRLFALPTSRAFSVLEACRRNAPRCLVALRGTKGFGPLSTSAPMVAEQSGAAAAPAPEPDSRLAAVRRHMAAVDGGKGVHAFIVPTEDPHMSEYSPDCYMRREYVSRFTGTAGTVVVTTDKALLWTDGRYYLQASQQLGPEWTLMKAGSPGCPDIEDWLADQLPEGARIGIDPFLHTVDAVRKLQRKIEPAGKQLVPLLHDPNPVDSAWGSERPAAPKDPLRLHPEQWAGESVQEKMARMRKQMLESKADALLVTALDEVAWLLNLRGSDVQCNPVFLSYCLVPLEGTARLYVDPSKVPKEVEDRLKASSVEVVPYERLASDVAALAADGLSLWVDTSKVSYAVYQAAKEAADANKANPKKRARTASDSSSSSGAPGASRKLLVELPSPVNAAKAVKNDAEMSGMREAHLRDGVALSHFFAFLEDHIAAGGKLTEVQVDEELTARRAAQPGFIGPSFSTIAGAGPNGAVIHYRAHPDTCRTVDGDTLLLLDSGGQYDCGTTDITRTLHLGTPSERHKMAYTRVLQGHIALDRATFPEGTPGCALDVLARLPLWSEGLNYRHGTGHGVGAALNVHEGPQSISSRFHITYGLQARMICSNEPGYYEDGAFGVRIENLVSIKEVETANRFGGIPYLGFDCLTLVPIQTKMVDAALMTSAEVAWLDSYHAQVWREISPRLEGSPRALEWLRANTRPLAEQQA